MDPGAFSITTPTQFDFGTAPGAAPPERRKGEGQFTTQTITPREDQGLAANVWSGLSDNVEGLWLLGKLAVQEGPSGVWEVAKKFPGIIADTYSDWYHIARSGKANFLEAVRQRPVEFVSDMLAPISIFFGGAGGIAAKLGTGARGIQAANALNSISKWANRIDVPLNPGMALVTKGIRSGSGAIFRGITSKAPLPIQRMNTTGPATRTGSLSTLIARIKEETIDRLHPFTQVARKTGNEKVDRLAHNFAGANQIADTIVENGGINYLTKERTGNRGLVQVIKDLGLAQKADFDDVLIARRAFELAGRKIDSGQDMGTAAKVLNEYITDDAFKLNAKSTKADVKASLNSGSFDPDFKHALDGYDAYNRDMMKVARDSGLISGKDFNNITVKNEFYTPFLRQIEEGAKARGGGGGAIKAIKGSGRTVELTTDSAMLMSYRIMREAELNQVGLALREVADLNGSGVKTTKAPTKLAAHVKPDEVLAAAGVGKEMRKAIAADNAFDLDLGVPIFRKSSELAENIIPYTVDGARKYLDVDPDVGRAYSSLRFDKGSELPFLALPGAAVARLQRAGITASPAFAAKNVLRDQTIAFIQSNYGFIPGWDFMRGFAHYIGKTKFYDDMKISGAMRSTLIGASRKEIQKNLLESIQRKDYLREIAPKIITNPLFLARELFRGLEGFAQAGEMATRLGAARRAFKKELQTKTRSEALSIAAREFAEVTTDFRIHGASSAMRAYTSNTAFVNARLQGLDRLGRAFRDNPVRTTTKAVLGISIPATLFYAGIKGDPEYEDTPQWEKDLFWHVKPGDTMYRISKPFEAGLVFGTVLERMYDAVIDEDPSALAKITGQVAREFQPFDLPTAMKPLIEIAANKNFFFDSPLEGQGQRRLMVSERANNGTTEISRLISKWTSVLHNPFGETTRGAPKKGAVLSPIDIDHLIFATTGTLGKDAFRFIDRNIPGGVSPPTPKTGFVGGPLNPANTFISNVTQRSQAVNDFHEINERLGEIANTAKSKKGLEGRRFRLEHRRDLADAKRFSKFSRQFFKLIKQQNVIRDNPAMSPSAKRRLIDRIEKIKVLLAKRALEQRRR